MARINLDIYSGKVLLAHHSFIAASDGSTPRTGAEILNFIPTLNPLWSSGSLIKLSNETNEEPITCLPSDDILSGSYRYNLSKAAQDEIESIRLRESDERTLRFQQNQLAFMTTAIASERLTRMNLANQMSQMGQFNALCVSPLDAITPKSVVTFADDVKS